MAMPPGNSRAPLVARVGAARVGATRVGWVPVDTDPTPSGAFYRWKTQRGTEDKETQPGSTRWTQIR
jgi:hypothetical protein